MSKEQIVEIKFNEEPDIRIRVIQDNDTDATKKSKIKYPFELFCTVNVTIVTDFRTFSFDIYNGYTWNGSDIPQFLWSLVGSRTDTQFLTAALLHDYILQFRKYMLKEVLHNEMTVDEYIRLTSLIFREQLKKSEVKTIKANIMSWFVNTYQILFNRKQWKIS